MAIEARTRTKFHKIGLLLNITKNLGGFMQNVGPRLLGMNQIRGVLKNKIIMVIRGTLRASPTVPNFFLPKYYCFSTPQICIGR